MFVVGSYNTGLTIRVPRMPVLGESLAGDSFDMGPGGKGSNQAVGAARLGADVRLLVCLGDDIFAENALQLYSRRASPPTLFTRLAAPAAASALSISFRPAKTGSLSI